MKCRAWLILILGAVSAQANTILDQSYLQSPNLNSETLTVINECCSAFEQTFTAGMDGFLISVAVDVQGFTHGFPLRLRVEGTTGGLPNGSVLAEVTLPLGGAAINQPVLLPQGIFLTAGTQYAIVADYPGGPPAGLGNAQGVWLGNTPGGYSGGSAGFWSTKWESEPGLDFHFQTFVQVPDATSSLGLFSFSIAILVLAGRMTRPKAKTCQVTSAGLFPSEEL